MTRILPHRLLAVALAASLLGTAAPAAHAQNRPAVEPKVEQVFRAAAEALGGAQSMSFTADVSRDVVLAYGQKIQLSNQRQVCVMRPGSIRGFNEGDLDRVDYWLHDGRVTVLDRDRNVFAQLETPDTIDAALDALALEHGLVMPLADMLVADPYGSAIANVESAGYAGLHKVRGIACHHLVFRQPGLDWQLWIDAGSEPLPVRMVITFTDQPHAPQWMADFHGWDLNPKHESGMFQFEAPQDAEQIDFDAFIAGSEAVEAETAGEAP
ncbi:MAG: DUF2092 domain-containing protein [Planctomycetota bacterium]